MLGIDEYLRRVYAKYFKLYLCYKMWDFLFSGVLGFFLWLVLFFNAKYESTEILWIEMLHLKWEELR